MEEEPRDVADENLMEPLLQPGDVVTDIPVTQSKEGTGKKLISNVFAHIRLISSSGIACMLLAQLFYGFLPLSFKWAHKHGMPVFQVLLFRSLSSVGMSLAMGLATVHWKKLFWIPNGFRWLSAVQAIFGNMGMMSFCISLMYMVEGDATALGRTSLIFASVLGWMIGWDVLSFQILVGVLVCCVGAIVVDHPPFLFGDGEAWSTSRSIGSSLAVFAAVSAAIYFITLGRIGPKVGAITIVLLHHACGALLAGIPLLAGTPSPPEFKLDWEAWLWVSVFCTFAFANSLLTARGTQLCNATLGASLQTASVIVTYLVGFFIVGEGITLFGVFGSLAIIVGIILIAKGKERIQKARELQV